jgi:dTDP-3-amino-3,4,6-trideoxy-alpha-D-glucose transaminase
VEDPSVPFVDLGELHASLHTELMAAFERVVAASGFILGEEVERFEGEFAGYCGAADCAGVSSGTAALTLALRAAGIGPGDEVVVPAHTYIASALGVIGAGATPVFCDVEPATGLMDPLAAAAAVSERTAALLPVHLYGQACDMDRIWAVARRAGLFVLEDAAQAHGATWRGRRAGSLGSAAAFSFYPSKNLGALGDGGAVCSADRELTRRLRELRNLGQRRKGEHVVIGANERLDGLQAALLRVKLPHLEGWNELRRRHAAAYRAGLPDHLLLPERTRAPCVYHLFPIRVAGRDALATHLARHGVATAVHYCPTVPAQPALAPWRAGAAPEAFAAAEAWARDELSLPMFPGLWQEAIDRVVELCLDELVSIASPFGG